MILLKFFFFVFIVGLVVIVFFVAGLYRRLHKTVSDFNKQMGGAANGQRNSQKKTTRTSNGDTIIDTRSHEEATRKIFDKDDGQYVDFDENPT